MSSIRGGTLALMHQDFTHKVSVKTLDEFNDLVTHLNDLSRQLNAAKHIADGFTPKSLPDNSGWSIAAVSEPCEATAGDYFDAFDAFDLPPLPSDPPGTPPATAILVADVTGHGLGPSLHMSACRSTLRALASTGLQPAKLLQRLDNLLQWDLDYGRFITLLYGVLHADSTFTYCNAGHGPALVDRAGVSPVPLNLGPHRPPLGIPRETTPGEESQSTLQLAPGDHIFIYSDGFSEVMNAAGDPLGLDPLFSLFASPSLTPDTLTA